MSIEFYLDKIKEPNKYLDFNREYTLDEFRTYFLDAGLTYLCENEFKELNDNHPIKRMAKRVKVSNIEINKSAVAKYLGISKIFSFEFFVVDRKLKFIVNGKDLFIDMKDSKKFFRTEINNLYVYRARTLLKKEELSLTPLSYINQLENLVPYDNFNFLRELVLIKSLNEDFIKLWNDDVVFKVFKY